jgi:translation initiation factor 2 gamma subunit (eIF-2gamma)
MTPYEQQVPTGGQKTYPRWEWVLDEKKNSCPDCGSNRVKVYKTEHYDEKTIKRVRRCDKCGMTHERHERVSVVDLPHHVDSIAGLASN